MSYIIFSKSLLTFLKMPSVWTEPSSAKLLSCCPPGGALSRLLGFTGDPELFATCWSLVDLLLLLNLLLILELEADWCEWWWACLKFFGKYLFFEILFKHFFIEKISIDLCVKKRQLLDLAILRPFLAIFSPTTTIEYISNFSFFCLLFLLIVLNLSR